ncbi:hypothetical protein [Parafrankia sp. Ea1.12]|uniref:hypothetical protein n=1 Tax=Parafrankia sp. Ea1.12 TaxID=573499 RepID=UPI001F29A178|nr:hypothetical protein [Parafrankia sp. Ea1.12]
MGHPDDDLVRERVDQPGLPVGQLECPLDRAVSEWLPGVRRVLTVEFADLVESEVPQPQRPDDDVERAGVAEPVRVAAGGRPGDPRNREAISGVAVAEIAQTAESD